MPSLAAARVASPSRLNKPAAVEKLWPESTVVCLAGGPSLTAEDVDACRGRAHVVAVNDAYRLAPWADVLYGSDAAWWRVHQGVPNFQGLKYSIWVSGQRWPAGVHVLRNAGSDGLEADPHALRSGRNSGYAAINLAVHLGARRIVLLGYDLQLGPDGKTHWFGDHPSSLTRSSPYAHFLAKFQTLPAPLQALGIEVVNCSRRTALKVFPMRPLREVLA